MPLFKWNTTGQVISNNFLAKQWRVTLNIDQKKVKNPRGFPVVEISQKKKMKWKHEKKTVEKKPSNQLQYFSCSTIFYKAIQFVGNRAKGRISQRVLQENKARQIFQKTNIWHALFSYNTYFEIRTFAQLPTNLKCPF